MRRLVAAPVGANFPAVESQNSTPGYIPVLEIDDQTGIIYAAGVAINTPGGGGGGPATQTDVFWNGSDAFVTVTADQAKGTVIAIRNSAPGSVGSFGVAFDIAVKGFFIVENLADRPCVVESTNFSQQTLIPVGTRFFFYIDNSGDSADVWPVHPVTIDGVPASLNFLGGLELSNASSLVAFVDQGNGVVQLKDNGGGNGNNLALFPALTGSVSSLRNKTLIIYIPAGQNLQWAGIPCPGFGFRMVVKTGTLTIGSMRLYAAPELDAHVAARSAQVKVNGVATNIVIDATGGIVFQTTDNTPNTVGINNGTDLYLAIFFADVAGNDTVTVGQATNAVLCPNVLVSGDQSNLAVSAAINGGVVPTSYASHSLVEWLEGTAAG